MPPKARRCGPKTSPSTSPSCSADRSRARGCGCSWSTPPATSSNAPPTPPICRSASTNTACRSTCWWCARMPARPISTTASRRASLISTTCARAGRRRCVRRTRIFRDHPTNPKQKQKTEGEEKMADATNKIAIVTGAGTGVGRAASLALMNAGFTVVLAGRRMEMLEETKKLGDNVGKSLCVSADMTDPGSIAALFAKVMETYGRLDVLFNNAGMGAPPVNFEDLTLAQWQAVVNTNLTGPFLCTQHAFRIMKDQNPRGGRIINNGSISAHAPRPFSAAYTSTKHAITGLTKASNLDGRMYDIAVGQVDIGNAATPMTDRMVAGPGVMQPDGTMKQEPRMDAKAVGDAVAYMAGLPLDANVLFMTVMATKMPFVGRG